MHFLRTLVVTLSNGLLVDEINMLDVCPLHETQSVAKIGKINFISFLTYYHINNCLYIQHISNGNNVNYSPKTNTFKAF